MKKQCLTSIVGLFIMSVFLVFQSVAWSESELFETHILAQKGHLNLFHPADVDGDGDLDLVTIPREGSGLIWYENRTRETVFAFDAHWTAHTIPAEGVFEYGMGFLAADMDGDDDLDLAVYESYSTPRLWLMENQGGSPPTWSFQVRETSGIAPTFLDAGDIDGDGDWDLLLSSYMNPNKIAWLEQFPGDLTNWPLHTVLGHTNTSSSLDRARLADFNGDGKLDIAYKTVTALLFFTQSDALRGEWTQETFDIGWSSDLRITDVDSDGDPDLIYMQSFEGFQILENRRTEEPPWRMNPLNETNPVGFLDPTRFDVADINQDGAPDVAVYDNERNLYWFANPGAVGSPWIRHTITGDLGHLSLLQFADLDQDADPDMIYTRFVGNDISWLENYTRMPDYPRSIAYSLEPGWNLISIPLRVDDTFSSQDWLGENAVLWLYDAAQQQYVQPSSLEPNRGYWVRSDHPRNLLITGLPVKDESVSLNPGWNLIGVNASFQSSSDMLGVVWQFTPQNQLYEPWTSTIPLQPRQAYWIYARESVNLYGHDLAPDIPPRPVGPDYRIILEIFFAEERYPFRMEMGFDSEADNGMGIEEFTPPPAPPGIPGKVFLHVDDGRKPMEPGVARDIRHSTQDQTF